MWRLVLAAVVVSSLTQPGLCQDSESRKFHIEQAPYSVTVSKERPLVVELQGLGQGSLVAIEGVDGSLPQAVLNAWFIEIKKGTTRQRITGEAVSGYEPLSKECFWNAGSNVRVTTTPKPDQKVVVHVAIPMGTTLELRLDGQMVYADKITSGFLIQRGVVTSNPLGYKVAATLLRASTSTEPASGQ